MFSLLLLSHRLSRRQVVFHLSRHWPHVPFGGLNLASPGLRKYISCRLSNLEAVNAL
jgi:hypothetical protein